MLDFWVLVFWILRPVDICTPGTAFPSTISARDRQYYHLHMHYIYIYVHICALAKPGFCSGGLISAKNGALLSTSLILVQCLVPVLIATMIKKKKKKKESTGAGMDALALLLAVTIVTFRIQLPTSVTMIATMVLIIII